MEFSGEELFQRKVRCVIRNRLFQKGQRIPKSVVKLFPSENKILLDDGLLLEYEILIVATGIQINWDSIKGLKESIGTNGVCSNYSYTYVDSTWREIEKFKRRKCAFTHPNILLNAVVLHKNYVLSRGVFL